MLSFTLNMLFLYAEIKKMLDLWVFINFFEFK